MAENVRKVGAVIFIICVVLFTLAAVLAIWDVFQEDVLYKSLSTIGVLFFASLVTLIVSRFLEKRSEGPPRI